MSHSALETGGHWLTEFSDDVWGAGECDWEREVACWSEIEIALYTRSWSPNPVLVAAIGADGCALLQAIDQAAGPSWLAQIPAVQILRRVEQDVEQDGPVRWREVKDMPAPATQQF